MNKEFYVTDIFKERLDVGNVYEIYNNYYIFLAYSYPYMINTDDTIFGYTKNIITTAMINKYGLFLNLSIGHSLELDEIVRLVQGDIDVDEIDMPIMNLQNMRKCGTIDKDILNLYVTKKVLLGNNNNLYLYDRNTALEDYSEFYKNKCFHKMTKSQMLKYLHVEKIDINNIENKSLAYQAKFLYVKENDTYIGYLLLLGNDICKIVEHKNLVYCAYIMLHTYSFKIAVEERQDIKILNNRNIKELYLGR